MKVGEELFFGGGRRFRVLDVVVVDEEDESPFVGCYRSRRRSALRTTLDPDWS
jgi:hypothetical protein